MSIQTACGYMTASCHSVELVTLLFVAVIAFCQVGTEMARSQRTTEGASVGKYILSVT